MNKKLKIIVPIVCVLVVIIAFYMIFDIKGKVEEKNYGTNNIEVNNTVDNENTTAEENVVDEENIVEKNNTISENTTIEKVNTTDKEEVSEEEDIYSSTKLDQARDLVKKSWGDDDTVYFTTEGVNSDGLYMVAVREKSSTAVKNYFKVNLETKKVEIDY